MIWGKEENEVILICGTWGKSTNGGHILTIENELLKNKLKYVLFSYFNQCIFIMIWKAKFKFTVNQSSILECRDTGRNRFLPAAYAILSLPSSALHPSPLLWQRAYLWPPHRHTVVHTSCTGCLDPGKVYAVSGSRFGTTYAGKSRIVGIRSMV